MHNGDTNGIQSGPYYMQVYMLIVKVYYITEWYKVPQFAKSRIDTFTLLLLKYYQSIETFLIVYLLFNLKYTQYCNYIFPNSALNI